MFWRRTTALVLSLAASAGLVAACDPASPSIEDWMHGFGLPLADLMKVNEETQVTVHLKDEHPELLIFTPEAFGGWGLKQWPAAQPTVNGGAFGYAYSLGPWDSSNDRYAPGYCYIFGAGQGPVSAVHIGGSGGRWQIVDPAVGGWVIVVRATVGLDRLAWRLVGPDGRSVFATAGRGRPNPYDPCSEIHGASPSSRPGSP